MAILVSGLPYIQALPADGVKGSAGRAPGPFRPKTFDRTGGLVPRRPAAGSVPGSCARWTWWYAAAWLLVRMARQRGIEVDPLVLPVIGGPLASLAREGPAVEAPGALLAGSASPGSHGTQGSPGAQGMTLHLPLAVAALGYLLAIALTLAIRGDARGHHRGGQQAAELSGQAHDFPFYARGRIGPQAGVPRPPAR
jgi:hypothetical protein